jgi:hypothetical protein
MRLRGRVVFHIVFRQCLRQQVQQDRGKRLVKGRIERAALRFFGGFPYVLMGIENAPI